jgi:hypothetical protein
LNNTTGSNNTANGLNALFSNTGSTGRFANATGTFNLGGQIDTNTGTFSLPWQGTISTVGSKRR